jgi:hypothetical protein
MTKPQGKARENRELDTWVDRLLVYTGPPKASTLGMDNMSL